MEEHFMEIATDNTTIDFIISSLLGLLAWFFGGRDTLLEMLLVMILIDYITGLSVAWIECTLSSSIGFRGIMRKCTMLTFVGIAHLLDMMIPDDPGAIRYGVCMFYIANEGKSIIENAHKLGVPIPQILWKHFENAHKKEDATEQIKNAA